MWPQDAAKSYMLGLWLFDYELNVFKRYPIVRLGFSRQEMPSDFYVVGQNFLLVDMKVLLLWVDTERCGSSLHFMFTQVFIFGGEGREKSRCDPTMTTPNPTLKTAAIGSRRCSHMKWMDGWMLPSTVTTVLTSILCTLIFFKMFLHSSNNLWN